MTGKNSHTVDRKNEIYEITNKVPYFSTDDSIDSVLLNMRKQNSKMAVITKKNIEVGIVYLDDIEILLLKFSKL